MDRNGIKERQEPIEAQFEKAMLNHGFVNIPALIRDGQIHKFNDVDQHSKPCWYILFDHGGAFGDYSRDVYETFRCGSYSDLSAEERSRTEKRIAEVREAQAKEKAELQRKAAEECQKEWDNAAEIAGGHPYLERKGVRAHGVRLIQKDGQPCIMVPLGDLEGIHTLQYIFPDGKKKLHYGGKVQGCSFIVGSGAPAYIAEGYATAASVFEATGRACVMAVSANNLSPVAAQFPDAVIVADNDKSGTGQRDALKAHEAHGNPVAIIPVEGMDANDYVSAGNDLKAFLEQNTPHRRGGFMLHNGEELFNGIDPKEWIIKHWIPEGDYLGSIFGASGSGKTHTAVDMAMSMATGTPWAKCKTRAANVLYLMGEGQRDTQKRMKGWLMYHGISRGDLPRIKFTTEAISLDERLVEVVDAVTAEGFTPEVIFIDTMAAHMAGDENSTQDAGKMVAALKSLMVRFNAAVIYIHHTGQDPQSQHRSRGSSAFKAALDFEYRVDAEDNGSSLRQTKVRDGAAMAPLYFRRVEVEVGKDRDGEPDKTVVNVLSDTPPESRKSSQQRDDEAAASDAVERAGFMKEGSLYIRHDEFVKALQGHLCGRNGAPMTTKSVQVQMNPKQERKFAWRLISYGFMEAVYSDEVKAGAPEQWHITSPEMLLRWSFVHGQQETTG